MISQLTVFLENEKGRLAAACRAVSDAGINIDLISTSEIRVTVLINEKDGVRAMNAVHDAFNLAD